MSEIHAEWHMRADAIKEGAIDRLERGKAQANSDLYANLFDKLKALEVAIDAIQNAENDAECDAEGKRAKAKALAKAEAAKGGF